MYNPYHYNKFIYSYSFPPTYIPYYPNGGYAYRPQYPEVDPTLFNKSAIEMQKLLKDASIILDRLAQSKSFDKKVMSAAQESKKKDVEQLIATTGVQSKVETVFTPDGLQLTLSSNLEDVECCRLGIMLRWR